MSQCKKSAVEVSQSLKSSLHLLMIKKKKKFYLDHEKSNWHNKTAVFLVFFRCMLYSPSVPDLKEMGGGGGDFLAQVCREIGIVGVVKFHCTEVLYILPA